MTVKIGVEQEGQGRVMGKHEEQQLVRFIPAVPEEPDETWWASVLADEPLEHESQDPIDIAVGEGTFSVKGNEQPFDVNWNKVHLLYENDEIVTLTVVSYNRGGVLVEGGDLHGFVPASHLVDLPSDLPEDERLMHLKLYLEREITLKVIECEPEKYRAVFSERAALAGAGQRKELLHRLTVGKVVKGFVTNVTSFGVFVDLGGLEGLIHVSELSWGRVHHPSAILKIGDEVETEVIEIMEEQGRVALSLKRLEINPWERLSQTLLIGDVVDAVVSSIVKYGVFARLDDGIEGLVHISAIPFPQDCTHIDEFLFEGQPVKVGIISIDPKKRRLGLTLESY
jgi:small subunit ribosomal protein S1